MRSLRRFMSVLLALCVAAAPVFSARAAEEGEAAPVPALYAVDPDAVHISTPAEFSAIWQGGLDGSYVLDCDLDLGWWNMRRGTFDGVLNGNGHTITYRMEVINDGTDTVYAGLFERLGGTVCGLTVNGTVSVKGCVTLGLLAGWVCGTDTIQDCAAAGQLTVDNGSISGGGSAKAAAGGLVGYLDGGVLERCTNRAAIDAHTAIQLTAGGILGDGYGIVQDCRSNAELTVQLTGENAKANVYGVTPATHYDEVTDCLTEGSIRVTGSGVSVTVCGVTGGSGCENHADIQVDVEGGTTAEVYGAKGSEKEELQLSNYGSITVSAGTVKAYGLYNAKGGENRGSVTVRRMGTGLCEAGGVKKGTGCDNYGNVLWEETDAGSSGTVFGLMDVVSGVNHGDVSAVSPGSVTAAGVIAGSHCRNEGAVSAESSGSDAQAMGMTYSNSGVNAGAVTAVGCTAATAWGFRHNVSVKENEYTINYGAVTARSETGTASGYGIEYSSRSGADLVNYGNVTVETGAGEGAVSAYGVKASSYPAENYGDVTVSCKGGAEVVGCGGGTDNNGSSPLNMGDIRVRCGNQYGLVYGARGKNARNHGAVTVTASGEGDSGIKAYGAAGTGSFSDAFVFGKSDSAPVYVAGSFSGRAESGMLDGYTLPAAEDARLENGAFLYAFYAEPGSDCKTSEHAGSLVGRVCIQQEAPCVCFYKIGGVETLEEQSGGDAVGLRIQGDDAVLTNRSGDTMNIMLVAAAYEDNDRMAELVFQEVTVAPRETASITLPKPEKAVRVRIFVLGGEGMPQLPAPCIQLT